MLKAGELFDRYTIEATVGQGGMGRVYRAYDARLGRRVAIKVISDASFGAEGDARLVRGRIAPGPWRTNHPAGKGMAD